MIKHHWKLEEVSGRNIEEKLGRIHDRKWEERLETLNNKLPKKIKMKTPESQKKLEIYEKEFQKQRNIKY